jgi:hypothetical protein
MKSIKALAAAVALAGMTSIAVAQSATGEGMNDSDSGMTAIPGVWSGPIGEAFYTDGSGAALRSEEEAMANFKNLPPEEQAKVQSDCQGLTAGTLDTGTTGSTDSGTTATDGANASDAQIATMKQVCDWVSTN